MKDKKGITIEDGQRVEFPRPSSDGKLIQTVEGNVVDSIDTSSTNDLVIVQDDETDVYQVSPFDCTVVRLKDGKYI